jgi:UDP-N-acetyl-D-mannosaminuronic acid transferase (WecB/TagA/CpsF family)
MMKKLKGMSEILVDDSVTTPQWVSHMGLEWLYVLLVAFIQ